MIYDFFKLDLRVSIAGHVDAGKSSLLGYLLWHLGLIPAAVQKSAEGNGKPSRFANSN
jgi:translation elongation factor EF-1alpha